MSTVPAVVVRDLSKSYRLGQAQGLGNFREMLTSAVTSPYRRLRRLRGTDAASEVFWALRGMSFDIAEGDVVGIVGRNGAGKSTLLKVLSRITEPTSGRVEMRGRIASLLEVGTGFHPELSGRENIYLNGAILGMSRREIRQKFDAIVEFAGVDRFLDTPVKRYSSGMYVRLAFSVAAFLEPEILIVDEVLAVGDAEFQRRCLGKMRDVSNSGRTVIFVSHNLGAVRSLCSRALLLEEGRLKADGLPEEITREYLGAVRPAHATSAALSLGSGGVRLTHVAVTAADGEASGQLFSGSSIVVHMDLLLSTVQTDLSVGFDLLDEDGTVAFRSYHSDVVADRVTAAGEYSYSCEIPRAFLNGRRYGIAPRISVHKQYWIVQSDPVVVFEVALTHGATSFWEYGSRERPGSVAPLLRWTRTDTRSMAPDAPSTAEHA